MVRIAPDPWLHHLPPAPRVTGTLSCATRWMAVVAWAYALCVAAVVSSVGDPFGAPSAMVAPAFGVATLWMGHVLHHVSWRSPWFAINAATLLLVAAPASYLAGYSGIDIVAHGCAMVVASAVTSTLWRLWLRSEGQEPALIGLAKGVATALGGATLAYLLAWAPLTGGEVGASEAVWAWLMRVSVSTFVVTTLGYFWLELPQLQRRLNGVELFLCTVTLGVPVPTILLALPKYTGLYLLLGGAVIAATMLRPRLAIMAISIVVLITTFLGEFRLGPFGEKYTQTDIVTTLLVFSLITTYVATALVAERVDRECMYTRLAEQYKSNVAQVELLNLVIESIADGVAVYDSDGSVILRNSAASLLHANAAEAQVAQPGIREGSATAAVLLGGENMVVTDVEVPVPGDEPRTVNVTAHALVEGPRRAVTILKDVTQERRHVEELQRFARVVAHDLRSPLTAISLWMQTAEMQANAGDSAGVQESLKNMLGTVDRMEALIGDLLEYSVAPESQVLLEYTDLKQLLESSIATQVAAGSVLTVHNTVQPGIGLMVNAKQFARIFDNLVSNAVKYAHPDRSAEITLSFERYGPRWGSVVVSDRGIGIPPGQERRIFDEMYRVPEHASIASGSGLGLAICRRIAIQHGGAIRAFPRPGGGTTFEVVVPLAAPQAAALAGAGESSAHRIGVGQVEGARRRTSVRGHVGASSRIT